MVPVSTVLLRRGSLTTYSLLPDSHERRVGMLRHVTRFIKREYGGWTGLIADARLAKPMHT